VWCHRPWCAITARIVRGLLSAVIANPTWDWYPTGSRTVECQRRTEHVNIWDRVAVVPQQPALCVFVGRKDSLFDGDQIGDLRSPGPPSVVETHRQLRDEATALPRTENFKHVRISISNARVCTAFCPAGLLLTGVDWRGYWLLSGRIGTHRPQRGTSSSHRDTFGRDVAVRLARTTLHTQ